MTLTLTIEVAELKWNVAANPDTAKLRWLAQDKSTGSIGKGETVSEAIAQCLQNLSYRI